MLQYRACFQEAVFECFFCIGVIVLLSFVRGVSVSISIRDFALVLVKERDWKSL